MITLSELFSQIIIHSIEPVTLTSESINSTSPDSRIFWNVLELSLTNTISWVDSVINNKHTERGSNSNTCNDRGLLWKWNLWLLALKSTYDICMKSWAKEPQTWDILYLIQTCDAAISESKYVILNCLCFAVCFRIRVNDLEKIIDEDLSILWLRTWEVLGQEVWIVLLSSAF